MDKIIIIAEAGVNHNGNIKTAKQLIDAAAKAGANFVKFQTFQAEKLVSKFAQKADYQKKTTDKNESQLNMIRKFELDKEAHLDLMKYCKTRKIGFLSSPFDMDSIDLLVELGLKIFKIPSGEITNLPYLRKIGRLKMEVILSTGMSSIGEIENSLNVLINEGTLKENITVLHCNTEYPTPFEDVNLKAMLTIKNAFQIKVGYSDHTPGIEIPAAAAALGACVIEKHFTLSRRMEGPDHKNSLEPEELSAMIKAIKNIEIALGNGIKQPSLSELKNKTATRKSIVALSDIKAGEIFTSNNLTCKRPGNGISPMEWENILGRKAIHSFKKDELIEL